MQRLVWDPVYRHPAELNPSSSMPKVGAPLLPLWWLARLLVAFCSVTNPILSLFSFSVFKGKLFEKAAFTIVSTGYVPSPPGLRQPPKCLRNPPPEGGGRGAQGRWPCSYPSITGRDLENHLQRPSRALGHPGQGLPRLPPGFQRGPLPTHLLAIKPTEKSQPSSWPVGVTTWGTEASGTMVGAWAEPRQAHFNTKLLGNCTKPLPLALHPAFTSPAHPLRLNPILLPASLSRGHSLCMGPEPGPPSRPSPLTPRNHILYIDVDRFYFYSLN